MTATPRRFAGLVLAAGLPALSPPGATAADPPKSGFLTEFRNVPGPDNQRYTAECVVTVEGHDKTLKMSFDIGAGMSAEGMCLCMAGAVKSGRDWGYEQDGKTVLLKGWTDPETKKFHPVKSVKFTSDDLPKESMPKVTDRWPKA